MSEKTPVPKAKIMGCREKTKIAKENNFLQPGVRYRSFDPARQDRFVGRLSGMLSDPRVTKVLNLQGVWIQYKVSNRIFGFLEGARTLSWDR